MVAIILWMAVGWSRPCAAESMLFNGKGVIYGGIGAGYYLNRLDGETHSRRFVFMSSYGLARWMDVFAQVGIADLGIKELPGRTDFRGEYQVAVGAGTRVRLLNLFGSRVVLYGEGSGFRFRSEEKASQRTKAGTIPPREYNWLEGEAVLGMEFPSIGFYAGSGVWGVQTEPSYLTEYEIYRSGTRWSGFVGKIFPLRANFRLDVRVTGPERASIRIALTQLYQPEEDPF